MIAKIKAFIQEVIVELKKVSWPTRDELLGSTAVVAVGIAVMTIFIGICDFIFSKAVHIILR